MDVTSERTRPNARRVGLALALAVVVVTVVIATRRPNRAEASVEATIAQFAELADAVRREFGVTEATVRSRSDDEIEGTILVVELVDPPSIPTGEQISAESIREALRVAQFAHDALAPACTYDHHEVVLTRRTTDGIVRETGLTLRFADDDLAPAKR